MTIFEPNCERHNFYSVEVGAISQYCSYFTLGFKNALLTPQEYFDKLTDYSEENKHLNYLIAYYLPQCEVNIIVKLGFGVGSLKRTNERYGLLQNERVGAPYQLKVNVFQVDMDVFSH